MEADNPDPEKALVILETLREKGGLRPVAARLIDDLTAQAVTMREAAARVREAALDYETIASMAKRKLTANNARAAFAASCRPISLALFAQIRQQVGQFGGVIRWQGITPQL